MIEIAFFIVFLVGVYHTIRFLYSYLKTGKPPQTSGKQAQIELLTSILSKIESGISLSSLKMELSQELETLQNPDPAFIPENNTIPVTQQEPTEEVISAPEPHQEAVPTQSHAAQQKISTPHTHTVAKKQQTPGMFENWYKENSITFLLYLGAFFIVMASIAFLGFTWDQLSGSVRFLALASITLGFGIAGAAFYRNDKVKQAGITFLGITGLLLPINGVAFQQYVLQSPETVGSVWALTSLLCLAYYAVLFTLIPTRFTIGIIHLTSLSIISSFVFMAEGQPEWYIFGAIIDSYLIFALSYLKRKPFSAEIRKFTDTSSQILLTLSAVFGFFYSVNTDTLFTWPTVCALVLTTGYFVLRWSLKEVHSYVPALAIGILTYPIALTTASITGEAYLYALVPVPVLLQALAAFWKGKTSHFEEKSTVWAALGVSWLCMLYAATSTQTLIKGIPEGTFGWDRIPLALLLGSVVLTHGITYLYHIRHSLFFWIAGIWSYLALMCLISIFHLSLIWEIVILYTVFIGVELSSKYLLSGRWQLENKWFQYISTGFSLLLFVYYAGTILENPLVSGLTLTVLYILNGLYYKTLTYTRERFYAVPALLFQFLTVWELLLYYKVAVEAKYITLYALTMLQLLSIWFASKKGFFEKSMTVWLPLVPSVFTILIQLSTLSVSEQTSPDVNSYLQPLSYALTGTYTLLSYFLWNRYAYIVSVAFFSLALVSSIEQFDSTNRDAAIVYALWTGIHTLLYKKLSSLNKTKPEAVTSLITATVFSFVTFYTLAFILPTVWYTISNLIWVHLILGFFILSRYRIYLLAYFPLLALSLYTMDQEIFQPIFNNQSYIALIFAGVTTLSLWVLGRYPAYRKELILGSGLLFVLSFPWNILPENKLVLISTSLIQIVQSIYLHVQWKTRWTRFLPFMLSYLAVFIWSYAFETDTWISAGLILVATIHFLITPFIPSRLHLAYGRTIQKISLGIATFATFIEWTTSLAGTSTEQIFHIGMLIATAVLYTEYWRQYRSKNLEYVFSFAWVLVILRIFAYFGIENGQVYFQPITWYLIGVGIYNHFLKRSPARTFILAGAILSILGLFLASFEINGFWYAAFLVLEGTAFIAIAISTRIKRLQNSGVAAIGLGVFSQTAGFIFALPWWLWLGLIGLGILGLATWLLSRKSS